MHVDASVSVSNQESLALDKEEKSERLYYLVEARSP
jgi:hypothetical protein